MDGEQAALAVGVLWVGAAEAARAARLREVCRQTKALITQARRKEGRPRRTQEGYSKTRRQNGLGASYSLRLTPLRATRVVVVAAAHNPAASMVVTDLICPLIDVADHVQHT